MDLRLIACYVRQEMLFCRRTYSLFTSHQTAEVCLAHTVHIVHMYILSASKINRYICCKNYRFYIFTLSFLTYEHISHFFCPQNLDIQVEDVRIRAILSSYRRRIPVTEGYVEVKDGGKWKQICNSEWTGFSGRVICGMFGFPGERKYNARVYK